MHGGSGTYPSSVPRSVRRVPSLRRLRAFLSPPRACVNVRYSWFPTVFSLKHKLLVSNRAFCIHRLLFVASNAPFYAEYILAWRKSFSDCSLCRLELVKAAHTRRGGGGGAGSAAAAGAEAAAADRSMGAAAMMEQRLQPGAHRGRHAWRPQTTLLGSGVPG